jgi:hypothetical protein
MCSFAVLAKKSFVCCGKTFSGGGGGGGVWFKDVSGIIGSARRAETLIGWCDIVQAFVIARV